ncbi:MAG: putative lipopolysaccharide heptosyltransferase III [Anaerolineae bacterium]
MIYALLSRLFPQRPAPRTPPARIVLILPCCIGDVVMATAALMALRRAYPHAHITWAVGSWSRRAIENHPMLDAIIETGTGANPAAGLRGVWTFGRRLRGFDLAVSLVRSPWMSMAVWLSGVPYRAGIDSAGRGFGYNLRARLDPEERLHETDIYLAVVRALGIDTTGCAPSVPVTASVDDLLAVRGIAHDFVVINPAGGSNPGMVMDSKRWPAAHFAALIQRIQAAGGVQVVLVAGPSDQPIVEAVQAGLHTPVPAFVGELSFQQVAALAAQARAYIGNDTGLTHLAAAAGARTVMILGPSDPARYAPYSLDSDRVLVLWKAAALRAGGVAAGPPVDWDWKRDGIGVEAAAGAILPFIQNHQG